MNDKRSFLQEFRSFLHADEMEVPMELSRPLRDLVRHDLEPSRTSVGLRLLSIHVFAAGLTLLICPQFGIGPLGGGDGLMGFFMGYGIWACALFCGSFFMSATAIAGVLFLGRAQRRVIRAAGFWPFSLLAFFSMILFMLLGSWVTGLEAFRWEFNLVWLLAAVLVGWGVFGIGEELRNRLGRLSEGL